MLQRKTHKDNHEHFQENTRPINCFFISNFEQVFACQVTALTCSNSIIKSQNKHTVLYKVINKTLVLLF